MPWIVPRKWGWGWCPAAWPRRPLRLAPRAERLLQSCVVYWQPTRWQLLGSLLAGGLRSAAEPGDSFYSYLKNKNKYARWKCNQLLPSSKCRRLVLPASAAGGFQGVFLQTTAAGMLFSMNLPGLFL